MCTEMQACDKHALDLRTPLHTVLSLSPSPSSLSACFRAGVWLTRTRSSPDPPRWRPWQFCPSMVLCTHAAVHAVSSATQALFCPPEKRQNSFSSLKMLPTLRRTFTSSCHPFPQSISERGLRYLLLSPPGRDTGQSDSWRGVRKNQELKGKSQSAFLPTRCP